MRLSQHMQPPKDVLSGIYKFYGPPDRARQLKIEEATAFLPRIEGTKSIGWDEVLYRYKGVALFHLQRYGEALPFLEEALKLSKDDTSVYKYKGAVLFHLQRYEEALTALVRVKSSEADAFASKYRGATLFHLEREVEALESLESVLNFF